MILLEATFFKRLLLSDHQKLMLSRKDFVSSRTFIQCRHLIPLLNVYAVWAQYMTALRIATQFPGHECIHMSLTSQLNVAFILKLSGSFMCLAYLSDMLSHTCQPQTKKKQEIFSRSSAATIYVSLPTSHQVPHLYI